jgi:hypothetical protein
MGILYYSMYIFILFLCNFILFYVLSYIILCIILYYSMYRLCVYVYKPLPLGVYPIAIDKYIDINFVFSFPSILKETEICR